jgi:hypothetical protein
LDLSERDRQLALDPRQFPVQCSLLVGGGPLVDPQLILGHTCRGPLTRQEDQGSLVSVQRAPVLVGDRLFAADGHFGICS